MWDTCERVKNSRRVTTFCILTPAPGSWWVSHNCISAGLTSSGVTSVLLTDGWSQTYLRHLCGSTKTNENENVYIINHFFTKWGGITTVFNFFPFKLFKRVCIQHSPVELIHKIKVMKRQ